MNAPPITLSLHKPRPEPFELCYLCVQEIAPTSNPVRPHACLGGSDEASRQVPICRTCFVIHAPDLFLTHLYAERSPPSSPHTEVRYHGYAKRSLRSFLHTALLYQKLSPRDRLILLLREANLPSQEAATIWSRSGFFESDLPWDLSPRFQGPAPYHLHPYRDLRRAAQTLLDDVKLRIPDPELAIPFDDQAVGSAIVDEISQALSRDDWPTLLFEGASACQWIVKNMDLAEEFEHSIHTPHPAIHAFQNVKTFFDPQGKLRTFPEATSSYYPFLLLQPGQADQVVVFPSPPTVDFLQAYQQVQKDLGARPFRLAPITLGVFEIGENNPRPEAPFPPSLYPKSPDQASPLRIHPRELWIARSPGQPDRLIVTGLHRNLGDIRHQVNAYAPSESSEDLEILPLSGDNRSLSIQRTLHLFQNDPSWSDEQGWIHSVAPPPLPEVPPTKEAPPTDPPAP